MPAQLSDGNVFRFDQSGALLRKVMENAAVGMTVVGADGRMIYVNPAFEQMLGCAPGECAGMFAVDVLSDADRQIVRLHYDRLLSGEAEDFRLEVRMRHRDGSDIWVLASASLLRSETTGRPLYAVIQVINIDRQKRAEEALAKSETRWSFALEAARQGVWDVDAATGDIFYSRTWRTIRGMAPDEYVDPSRASWLARLHPEDRERIAATIEKQERGEDGFDTIEYRERHRAGHYIWILSRGRPVEWDAQGNRVRTIGTDTDITRFKTVEAELANQRERFSTTLESIADGVISTDAEERIIFMNPPAEAMTGWLEADAIGRRLGEVFNAKTESTGEQAVNQVARCLGLGQPCHIEEDVVLASRDGTGRGVSGTAAPVRAEDGRLIGAVLVFRDVTDTQDLQRKLAHSANHDALTGLPNRTAFARALAEARRQAVDEQRCHALCFIDLDRFKPVNDNAGHAAGDALLQKVAQVIRMNCRSHDFAARIGGDEFVLLLADCSLSNARVVGGKLVDAIAGLTFNWDGFNYAIGASVGIAAVSAEPGSDPLAEADAACYAAKAAGRGQVALSA